MNPAPTELPREVLGVFAYLDVVLTAEEQEKNFNPEHYDGLERMLRTHPRERLKDEFRLMYGDSPLRKALDPFRLYHKEDMAQALLWAYQLHKQGGDPLEALTADYCLRPHGLLTWIPVEEVKELGHERRIWWDFYRFYREGDRFVRYSVPSSRGLLLLRGDRLVWEHEEFHFCIVGPISKTFRKWTESYEKFKALGGNRAFLAGEFDWPPPGSEDADPETI